MHSHTQAHTMGNLGTLIHVTVCLWTVGENWRTQSKFWCLLDVISLSRATPALCPLLPGISFMPSIILNRSKLMDGWIDGWMVDEHTDREKDKILRARSFPSLTGWGSREFRNSGHVTAVVPIITRHLEASSGCFAAFTFLCPPWTVIVSLLFSRSRQIVKHHQRWIVFSVGESRKGLRQTSPTV